MRSKWPAGNDQLGRPGKAAQEEGQAYLALGDQMRRVSWCLASDILAATCFARRCTISPRSKAPWFGNG
jgi:hypothetical protein